MLKFVCCRFAFGFSGPPLFVIFSRVFLTIVDQYVKSFSAKDLAEVVTYSPTSIQLWSSQLQGDLRLEAQSEPAHDSRQKLERVFVSQRARSFEVALAVHICSLYLF